MLSEPSGRNNPYLRLADVLHELFGLAAKARSGKTVSIEEINRSTDPWKQVDRQARRDSLSRGIPFAIFDAALGDGHRQLQELVQVAAGNESCNFYALDPKYLNTENRLRELGETFAGAGADSTQAKTEQPEETGVGLPDIPERQREILTALLLLGAVTDRNRVARRKAASKADPEAAESTYNRPIAALAGRGLIGSKKGPDGGIWLTSNGEIAAQSLRKKTYQ
ncbi:MAG: hypothetical protein ACYC3I_01385 [Gemmataceae bacterium]